MLVNIARNMLHSTNSKTQGPGKHVHSYIYIYIYIYKWHACPGSYKEGSRRGGMREEGVGRSAEGWEERGGRMDDSREGRGWRREQ